MLFSTSSVHEKHKSFLDYTFMINDKNIIINIV